VIGKSKEQRRAEHEISRLQGELGPFVTAAQSTRMPMIFTNAQAAGHPIIFANDSFLDLVGYSRHELLGKDFGLLTARDADYEMIAGERNRFDRKIHTDLEAMFRRKDGSQFWAAIFISPVLDAAGHVVQHFLSLVNLTKYKRSVEALHFSEGRFRMAATAARLGVADINLVTREEHWSIELCDMLGVSRDTIPSLGAYLALIHPDDRAAARDVHIRSLQGEAIEADQGAYRIIRASDNAVRWVASERHAMHDSEGNVIRVVVTNLDVTDTKTEHDLVVWAATHDAVTGLPNRTYFRTELEAALATAATAVDGEVSLLLIDLDRFKHINDLLGHQAGDDALSVFAGRVTAVMPTTATLARLGGDEFAAILPGVDIAGAADIAQRLIGRLKSPFSVSDRKIDLHASIGISTFPLDGKGAPQLIHSADLALYAAKKAGGARARTFTPQLRDERRQQLSMLRHARRVLDNGWIEPFYQPKVNLATGRIAGFEALLRWRHPRVGLQSPATIAYAFDDIHTAGLLGRAMAEAVLSDIRGWMDRGIPVGKVAMNVSAAELRDTAYAQRLLASLAARRIPPAMIELEITETAFLDDRACNVVAMLNTLRAAGMTVALDDFGTGFSSLSHIRDFPVDTIKIDSSFIAGIDTSQRDRAITEAVLTLGIALGLTTVAEGIETYAQADFLVAHNCRLGQGYLFSPAVGAAAVEELVLRRFSVRGFSTVGPSLLKTFLPQAASDDYSPFVNSAEQPGLERRATAPGRASV
jgi:diguanylate cyclase (GGDEF)-like protein/PAS domain S-box-containing protein